jgi:glycosyltransferase involved in cell wall biosynthesis
VSRVVMFVFNDCTTDARVLREAGSLAAAGHEVTIMARPKDSMAAEGDRETRDGFEIVRVPIPQGHLRWRSWARYPWRARWWLRDRLAHAFSDLPSSLFAALGAIGLAVLVLPWAAVRLVLYLLSGGRTTRRSAAGGAVEWLLRWELVVLGWAREAARAAPTATVYHGHDLTAISAARYAAEATGGKLVYDSHEIFLESGANARRPAWARGFLARLERRGIARAAALVTVNDAIAEELGRRYRLPRAVVVHNCPPRWTPPVPRPDLIREATGIPASAPVALYHGAFAPHRGLENLAEAILEPGLEQVHVVFLGYGNLWQMLDDMSRDVRYGGRLHVLPAVTPDRLQEWVASADVGVMTSLPTTLNHLLATPNKLFECLAAGVPVVASDFRLLRRVIVENPEGALGTVCDPADVSAVAGAIRSIVTSDPEARAALRERCLQAAHDRWNWETEVARLLDLYRDLAAA